MKHRNRSGEDPAALESSLRSMLVSLLLVALVIGFVFGLKHYLSNRTYIGNRAGNDLETTGGDNFEEGKEYLKLDNKFESCYLMVREAPSTGLWANRIPGKENDDSESLVNGQILKAEKRGYYEDEIYYRLDNGMYVKSDVKNVVPLASYEEMSGYLAITYISSSGVRLRAWADFDTDNVVKSVYVGDKVQVTGKVVTKKGESAYITDEGLYITADTRYFNDYTSAPEEKSKEEETIVDKETKKEKPEETTTEKDNLLRNEK